MSLKSAVCIFFAAIVCFVSNAQNDSNLKIKTFGLQTRADYDYHTFVNSNQKNYSGITGKYLQFNISGDLTDRFSFSYSQRILPVEGESSFFDGTDWIYLQYNFNKNFYLSAGKQVLAIGGFEYDLPPIDVYYYSDFWSHITCYQMGISAGFVSDNNNHCIIFQVANSSFSQKPFDNLYGYNLIWYGNVGVWKTIYSANLMEYADNSYIHYAVLGNKFDFGKVMFYCDFINRYCGEQGSDIFDDFSAIGEIKWNINDAVSIFGKGGYDVNDTYGKEAQYVCNGDLCNRDIVVVPGTEYYYYGLGFELYPLKSNHDVRIHGFAALKDNDDLHFNAGLTWKIDFLKKFSKLAE